MDSRPRSALLARAAQAVRTHAAPITMGRVARVTGLLVEAHVPDCRIGDVVEIERDGGRVAAEVVGLRDSVALLIALGEVRGISAGARVHTTGQLADIPASEELWGRLVDAFGRPIDGGAPLSAVERVPLDASLPLLEERTRIAQRFDTGVRVIDGLLTCGRGQRIGIFAGAGVGKTVLIRQIAMQAHADVTVIGLIGERGAEVRDLLATHRSETSVIVAATSDRSPLERVRGARAALTLAEHFRDRGANVLLILDSLTRYAMALREIGLAIGEPPATKGYPPSVFAALPRLLERVSPMGHGGSITGFFTVLVEGDDLSDPVADSARSLLDAHIVLSRDQAARGHFPAVDVLASASRVARQVTTPEAQAVVTRARSVLATRREVSELKSLGAYVAGANPAYDEALALGEKLDGWSAQGSSERSTYEESMASLGRVLAPPA